MPISISGSGTVTGLAAGGLPDASVQQADLAANVAGNGPAFHAYRSAASAALTQNSWSLIAIDTEVFDTANAFDPTSTTSWRFQPLVAGYYQINFSVLMTQTSASNLASAVYKNGVIVAQGSSASTTSGVSTGTALVFLNGSTDYLQLYAIGTGTSPQIVNSVNTFMSGYLARSA